MALVLMCGQPCCGKSKIARRLKEALEGELSKSQRNLSIALVDEESLNLSRNESYSDVVREKNLRGVLRSTIDRTVTKEKIVIVDSLNSIKGYRYELWCLARAAGTQYCVVHCDVNADVAREWNRARGEGAADLAYSSEILEDLLRRFERPDSRNRWDSPLFEIRPASDSPEEQAEVVDRLVDLLARPKSSRSRGPGHKNLQPTIATQSAQLSDANVLYELDQATQEVLAKLMEGQALAMEGGAGSIQVANDAPLVRMSRPVGLPELRRHRRTFLKLAGQASLSGPPPPSDRVSARRMFIDYLNTEFGS